jgi:hypothetical protein
MRKPVPSGQRGPRAVWAAALSVALTLAWGTGAFAQSAEDEEDLPWDTKIMRQLMKDLGLRRDGERGPEYRERAPLVVPPSRTLPPPRAEGSVATNPAWPKDPDEAKRRVEAAKKKAIARTAAEAMEAEGRALTPAELERGRVAAGTTSTTVPPTPEDSGRPMSPSALGGTKSIWGSMFSSFTDKGEVGEFTGEPTRSDLTAPPPGYQTPSPAQPYGLGSEKDKTRKKALTVEDRMTGVDR